MAIPTTSPTPCAQLAIGPTQPVMHKKNQAIKMVGTDLFRYREFSVIQFMMQQEGRVLLHLMVFKRPGLFLQIVFLIAKERYHASARAVETAIASLRWNPGGDLGPSNAGP